MRYYLELLDAGKTDIEARNIIIHDLILLASCEACRIARSEDREPSRDLWHVAADWAFDLAAAQPAVEERTDD
jgi:hypothetical protein